MQHSCKKHSLLCDSTQEIMRHLHAYTTQLALLDMYAMYASLAHVRHRGQTYQLASGMLGARREGPADAPTSQAAATRCRKAPRMPRNEAHAKCKTFESGSGLGLTSKFNIVWIGLSRRHVKASLKPLKPAKLTRRRSEQTPSLARLHGPP